MERPLVALPQPRKLNLSDIPILTPDQAAKIKTPVPNSLVVKELYQFRNASFLPLFITPYYTKTYSRFVHKSFMYKELHAFNHKSFVYKGLYVSLYRQRSYGKFIHNLFVHKEL